MHNIMLVICIIFLDNQLAYSATQKQDKLSMQIDFYGNKWINAQAITPQNLQSLINTQKHQHPGKAIFTDLSLNQVSKIAPLLQGSGFVFFAYIKNKFRYCFKNDSPVPEPMTSIAGAQGIIVRSTTQGEMVLVAQEKTRPDMCGFIGGTQDKNEFIRETMLREIKEEVGISDITIEYLLAIRNRTQANPYNANDHCYFYIIRTTTAQVTLQSEEILQAQWVLIKDILDGTWKKMKLMDSFVMLLRHYAHHTNESKFTAIKHFKQLDNDSTDNRDVMHYEIFAKPK